MSARSRGITARPTKGGRGYVAIGDAYDDKPTPNPEGNREERRAAAKIGITAKLVSAVSDES